HVRRELQLVLDESGRRPAAVGHANDISAPVDDDEMALVEIARVASVQPAFCILCLGGGLPVVQVAPEHARRAEQDLAVATQAQLGAVNRCSDGVEPDIGLAMRDGESTDLGLSVDLLEIAPYRVEEPEPVRRQRCTAGVAPPDAGETELVPDGPEA